MEDELPFTRFPIIEDLEATDLVDNDDIYREILEARSRREPVALATIVKVSGSTPGKLGFKMLVLSSGKVLGTVGGGCNEANIVAEAMEAIRTGEARLVVVEYEGADIGSEEPLCGGSCEVFIEPILPPPTLYIFGAGHVGQSLAKVGKVAGFRIVIIDDREEFANKERFPDADEILVTDFSKANEKLKLSGTSCIVVATRGHKNDRTVLRSLVECDLRYIGMIGSKKKVKETFGSLERDGTSRELLQKVHAPIGLSIGAKTPAEIAISIVAEIISTIRTKNCSIHDYKT